MENRAIIGGNRIGNKITGIRKGSNGKFREQGDLREVLRQRNNNNRPVTFKASRGGQTLCQKFISKKSLKFAIKTTIENDCDDLVDIPDPTDDRDSSVGPRPRFRRSGSPHPSAAKRKLMARTSEWFQITIPHGQKYDQEFIMESLQSLVDPITFTPHHVKVESLAICLFVNDIKVAQTLLEADRKFTLPDGYKMIIRVRNNYPPVSGAELKEKIKAAMAKRYIPETKALDLSKFHTDHHLKDVFCPLARPAIMIAVIDIIVENIPDLEALDLSDNKLHKLDCLRCLETKLPSLNILHLANNNITSVSALDALQKCKLIDLVLRGNPLMHRLREEVIYVSEIRKKLPSLQRLDFVNLPQQIGFDIPDNSSLPAPKPTFLCNSNGTEMVRQFLEQYFTIFDSDNRKPLLAAYDEKAMFSLTVNHNSEQGVRLGSNLQHNRNILRNKNAESSCRYLKNGNLSVVASLSELPATQHDLQSFGVDLVFFTSALIQLIVTGVFRQRKEKTENLRSFQKTLVIVPSGSGFCIKNEVLHINHATKAQMKTAFKSSVATSPEPEPLPLVKPPSDQTVKLQMIKLMSERSNMNFEWSERCLIDNNWDFEKASSMFTELNAQQKVPVEAFIK